MLPSKCCKYFSIKTLDSDKTYLVYYYYINFTIWGIFEILTNKSNFLSSDPNMKSDPKSSISFVIYCCLHVILHPYVSYKYYYSTFRLFVYLTWKYKRKKRLSFFYEPYRHPLNWSNPSYFISIRQKLANQGPTSTFKIKVNQTCSISSLSRAEA